MRRVLMCLAAVLLTAGFANARTVWNPTDPNTIAAGYSNWNIVANWTAGIPVNLLEATNTAGKAVFYGLGKPECQVTTPDATCYYFVLGDGEEMGRPLRIMNGGTLTTGANWSGVGYNKPATLIVEKGGTVNIGNHLWIASNSGGVGTIILNGGTITVKDAIDLGRTGTAVGKVYINEGLLRARYLSDAADSVGSVTDIKFGTLAFENNYLARPSNLWSRIDAGTIVGFGGKGTLKVERTGGLTRVTATSPMNPSPAYSSTVAEGVVPLSWTNMDPNKPGDPVYVDVWFGTDPDKLSLAYSKVVPAGENTTAVNVNALVVGTAPTTYYWQVDSYIYGSPTGDPIEGDVFKFDVTNDFPPTVVIDTPDTVTWGNQPVQLNATVSDTGTSALTITWTANNPGVVFTPGADVEDPVVTINPATFPATVTLTCSVKDALNPQTNSDTLVLAVYSDPCQAARQGAGQAAVYPMDIAAPYCVMDIADLAAMALDWMTDYTLTVPTVIP